MRVREAMQLHVGIDAKQFISREFFGGCIFERIFTF
jgi:hypothetical protein